MANEIKAVSLCSSCKFANFGQRSWGGGKKMTGVCSLLAEPQKSPLLPTESDLYDSAVKHSMMMPLSEYLELSGWNTESKWNKFKSYFDWWKANRPSLRRIHKENACDGHERGKVRRTVAWSIAKTNGKINWEK